ncbi:MAG TPA: hypothetical protein VK174_01325, partial [Chitinophagales bacterium]|nr:hypothetical protein [Chitinophagales bacterium]
MRKILLFALLCGSLFTAKLYAQFPGCPSVNIAQGTNGVLVLPCGQTCTNLTATAFAGAQSTSYTVSSIPYTPPFPFNTGTQILVNTDDIWSGVISLPFNFCFFGNTYNRIIVGSNGVCSFNVTNAAAGNSWQIPGTIPSATPADLTNSIMCPWQDIDPTNQGQVFYEIGGSYPCRYFKVSWFNVPYYGDPNSVNTTHCQGIARRATQQVILYETSNVIDMYIERKDVCSDWNNGRATQGIQNANGTVAYVVPGRNASVWTATNDAQRFTPAGAANYTIAWFNGATQIGTGNTLNVCPVGGTTYRAEATYADCAGTQVVVNSYLYVNTSGVTSTVDSVHEVDCFNGTTGAAYASFNSNSAVLSYGWSPGGTPNSTSITGIGPGTYTFTVTDASNCTSSSTVTLTNPAAFTVNVPDTSITSCNGGTASLTATPSGGVAGYTYLWTPGNSTNQTITGIGSGTYTVTVTDSRNCTATDAGTVTITGSSPTFNPPVITDATCAGNNGSIVVSVAGAVGTVSYAWSPTQPDNDTITGLAAGTYSVTATDGNGCTVSATYTVGGGAPIAFGAPVITDATCAGNDGSIVVTVTGATDPISYNWSPAQPDNDTITGLASGSYSVTATDANGCTASATYNVGAGAPITFGAPVITDASCTGLTGSIVVTVTGATDPISYNWSPAQPDNDTITGLAAGTYSVTATDANGCTASASYNVGAGNGISFGPAVLQNASCSANDGGIIVTVNNATPPIDYVWSNGLPNNDTVGGLGAGIYNVTATDANGCTASASYTITKAATFTFNPPVITDASCGASNGSIVVSVSGAAPPLDYVWTGGLPNNDTVTGLAAGSYTVTVTDGNGCSDFATYTVGQNNSFTLGAPVITNAGCTTNDGSIVVTTPGAAQPVTFVWSPAQANNDTITGLAVGNYSVTATDANGCTASATYNVGQNTSIVITNATVNDVSCSGTGSISVTATGGTGTLTYTWAPTGSGNPATGLAAGTYTLTITDQGGCSLTATYIVGNTPCGDCPAVSTDNNVTIPCGESCTTLAATAIAGYKTTAYSGAPIAYNPTAAFNTGTPILANIDDTWSGVITLPFNFCFFGSTYNRLIVGSNGIVSFNINQANGFNEWEIPGPLPSTATPDVRNAIMGPWHDMDPTFAGSISYSVIDSYPCRKFVVSWFDTPMFGDPNSVNDGICTDEYHQTQQIVLYETTNVIDIYIQEKESCVDWNDGLAIEGIQNAAGTVAYTVPGRNATVWSAANDGYRFTPAGAPNYVINWFEGNAQIGSGDTITVCPDSSTIYRVEAVYTNCDNSTITVSDSVFVTVEGSVTVSIDSFTNVSCNGGNDGAVYASYSSTDSTIVSFGWTPNGAGLTSLTGIPAGTYVFSATNAAGCTVTDTVVLSEPAPLVANVPDTTVYNCVQGPVTVSLTATATGGTSAYGFEWAGGQTTATITVNATGTYTVTVTDANGCTATDAGTVTQVIADPIFNTPVITNVTCNGADNGSIVVSVSQATPPIVYNWSNGLSSNDTVTDLDPGTYTVTATDANGCSVTASYSITEPTAIVIGNPTITDAGCTVGGTITVTATGGTGTLTYDWSNGDSGTFADSLAAGSHTLTVTDANGCTATATYTVNAAPGSVAFGPAVVVNVSCNGGNNGSVHVVVTGGTAPFVYVWSPNVSTDSTADGLAAGTYNVTVTDNQGCSASTTNTVTQPAAIT